MGGGGGNEGALLEEEVVAEELADGSGVGMVSEGIAVAFGGSAVVFSDPETAAALGIVEFVLGEDLLDLFEAEFARESGGSFVAGGFNHEAEFVTEVGRKVGSGGRAQLEIGEEDGDFGDAGGVFDAVGMEHGETGTAEIEDAEGGVFGEHAEFFASGAVDGFQLGLKSGVER